MRSPAPVLVLLALSLAAAPASADDGASAGVQLRVDVEPAAYVLRGYSAHLRVSLPQVRRLVVGTGAYGFDVPSLMVDLAPDNRGEDWDVRLVVGYNVFFDYFFAGQKTQGWEAGFQLGLQHYRARNPAAGDGDARFINAIALGRVGYEWHPWSVGFYFFPWLGLAYTTTVSGEARVGAEPYDVFPILPYGAVELGWRF